MTTKAQFLKAVGKKKVAVEFDGLTLYVTSLSASDIDAAQEFKKKQKDISEVDHLLTLVCLSIEDEKGKKILKAADYPMLKDGTINAVAANKLIEVFTQVNLSKSLSENVKN